MRVCVCVREGRGERQAADGGVEEEHVYCSCEKKSTPGLEGDGADAAVFNYRGIIPIPMSHLGVEAPVWLWFW